MDQLEALYRQHAPAVLRFACGLTGDRSLAEDIVSETFVRLLSGAQHIETRTARAYLFAIARNLFLNGLRRRRREVLLEEDTPAPTDDPAGALDDRARLALVVRALDRLPEHERAALLLRVDHDLPYEDIAAALGARVGTVKVWVHRARARLALLIDHPGGVHEARRDP
jgi:RNA polymerase sigma-70 factor (ECF subfamily)